MFCLCSAYVLLILYAGLETNRILWASAYYAFSGSLLCSSGIYSMLLVVRCYAFRETILYSLWGYAMLFGGLYSFC